MNRKEIRERVEVALQDVENRHWSDIEINQFIDDALVDFTMIARYPQIEGTATNPGSSASLGEATKTGTLSVDGKTATITFGSVHNYAENDVLRAYCPTYFTVTVDASTNVITSDGWHGFTLNDPITFATSGILPSGLSTATFYVKTIPSTTTFTVSATSGGSVTSISDTGTGVHKVNVSRTQPNEYLGPFNIKKVSDTVITYPVDFGNEVSSDPISVFRIGPVYTKPSTIAEITSVSIDGRELAIYTESEMNAAASSGGQRHFMLESSMGFHPNPFSFAFNTVQNTPRWREQIGPIEAVVFNNRTADTFRIYPLPKEDRDIYVDKDATTKVFQKLTVRGVPVVTGLSSDTSSPTVNSYWHESMVFGALERAWLKESKVQNVEKSQMYRAKFLEQAMQAQKMEGMSSGAISEGRNQGGFRINRSL